MIPSLSLFLGFPLTNDLEVAIKKNPMPMVSLFTSGGVYLSKRSWNSQTYLGKECPLLPTLSLLEDLEKNIRSFLQRLVPDYLFSSEQLQLIIIESGQNSGV